MDIVKFTEMLRDKHFNELKKLKYKYSEDFDDFLENLKKLYYRQLPLCDMNGERLVYTQNHSAVSEGCLKLMLRDYHRAASLKSREEEIISTCAIENIDISRESVRSILKGFAPVNEQENRIYGLKKGFEFISDKKNVINEKNLNALYNMTVGEFLDEENRLKNGNLYRDDTVFVVGNKLEHEGPDWKKIPLYMDLLFSFINSEDEINDIIKACIIHYYIAFIHPYFDGNGRIARLVHLWYLIQRDYDAALFVPFSSEIEQSRRLYYEAFSLINENRKISSVTDVTPFISYFINNVYNKIKNPVPWEGNALFDELLSEGRVTQKEKALWTFILSYYSNEEFSTKMLERDFSDAAYATIRDFVIKFEKYGLLTSSKYGNRTKYRIVH